MINVTQPFLPPKEEFEKYVDQIWQRNWLTNNGPLVNELELKLKEHLRLKHLLFVSNGTIAIQLAIKALELKGEIITTPFSYVATTSSIVWENCKPVYVDIDSETLNIDPNKIEAAITPNTSAILATHVYGNPCDIDAIQKIADKHKLKIIYDAAHCFGTTYKGRSVLEYGDISTISFHATKVFHTTEGGAVVTNNPELLRKLALLRNFGHNGPEKFEGVGINGKNSEFHAAMGLCNLNHISQILDKRKADYQQYMRLVEASHLRVPKLNSDGASNFSYFPILCKDEKEVLQVKDALEKQRVFTRRYFYPSLNTLDYCYQEENCDVVRDISSRILCLPLYFEISQEEIDMIIRIIKRTLNYAS